MSDPHPGPTRRAAGLGGLALLAGASSGARAAATRSIVDMAGRTVGVRDPIRRLATFGPVPVINSFVFAFRDQAMIVNALPPNFARSPRWKYQSVFAPGLASRPVVQGAGNMLLAETMIAARPDVVLTMSSEAVHEIEGIGLPVVYLAWDKPDEVKRLMILLADLLGKPQVGRDYAAYFDATVARVGGLTAHLPRAQRPKVLYCDLMRLTQPHLIAEWWIPEAGGISVTDDGRKTQSITFSLEQMLAWDPDVIIVSDARQVPLAYSDPRFRSVSAVRSRRVHVAPSGAHLWTNRTVEEPLTVLWAATLLHPDLTRGVDMRREAAAFYQRFFGVALRPNQIDEILRGVGAE